jgi:dihydrodipicolinate synthase/N-acetylneuraminate lyase
LPVILANIMAEGFMPLPEGLLIELATPLTPAGALDQGSMVRLVDRAAPWAAALVAGCPGVGEALELPLAIRLELFDCLTSHLPPELPLFFGITGGTPEETQNLALHLEDKVKRQPTSRPLYWVDLSLWWHSNRGLPQTYARLGQILSQPLVLMNHPRLIRRQAKHLKHLNLRTAVFKKLTTVPGLVALIYRGDMGRFLHYCAAMAARPEFILYEADEQRFLTRPGARGVVSAGAQLFPAIWQQVATACLFPEETLDFKRRRSLMWEWSNLLVRLYELYQLYPAPLLKLGLQHQGVLEFSATWPATPAFPAHLGERFMELLDRIEETSTYP